MTASPSGPEPDLPGLAATLGEGGGPVVVVLESTDGSAAALVDLLPPEWRVARATGSRATQAKVGGVADELDLEDLDPRLIVIEDAQWADPTSLDRLQDFVAATDGDLAVVLAHRPGADDLWVERFAGEARHQGLVRQVTVERPSPELSLPAGPAADLVLAADLVAESVSVAVAARLLGVTEGEALEVAEGLVADGWLRETRRGFHGVRPASAAGEARVGYVAGRLAAVMEEVGEPAAVVGNLYLAAGEAAKAFPLLAGAAAEAQRNRAEGEAFHLATAALAAADETGVEDRAALGALHLASARFLRNAGRSEWAAEHARQAATQLEGASRIDALGFAAAVADDRQHPQEAETILAVAEWEATRLGEIGKLGSLSSLRARELHRIGFTAEADAMDTKAQALLEVEGGPVQRFHARSNRAWIHFDRGEVDVAESEFASLVAEAAELEGDASVADKKAWHGRSLFAVGSPAAALEEVTAAERLGAETGTDGPIFVAGLARTEGALAYGRYADALTAADRTLALVERQFPAWENMARLERAEALLGLGRTAEAAEETERAWAVTPAGANGWRWRLRAEALSMQIATAQGRPWDRRQGEDLFDRMLQAHLFGWAADLMCHGAYHGKDRALAREAMALALRIGNPMLAAKAASTGRLWREPAAAPVIRAVRAMQPRLPPDWEDDWLQLPAVSEALAQPEPVGGDEEATTAVLDEALRRAGLAGAEVVLSPAQRRSHGLIRRGPRFRAWQLAAAGLGVVALAGVTSFAVARMGSPPDTPSATVPATVAVATAPPVTEPPTLEETELSVPEDVDFFSGTAQFRGGPERTGLIEATGVESAAGHYWVGATAGPIEAAPVAYGRNVLVGSTDGTFYAFDQTSGAIRWRVPNLGRVSAAPVVGQGGGGESGSALVVVGTDDGVVWARDALAEIAPVAWQTTVGTRVRSSPVIADGTVFVASEDGFVHALDLANGDTRWRFPAEGDGIGTITANLAFRDGIIYVGTHEGFMHLVDAADGTEICVTLPLGAAIDANPIIAGDITYVATTGFQVFTFPVGKCEGLVADRSPIYGTESPVTVAPAVIGDKWYMPNGRFLYARDLADNSVTVTEGADRPFDVWPPSTVDMDTPISTPPVVANGIVYFGTEGGLVAAVDAETGERLWSWQTGAFVRGSPAVVDGVVFIVSGDGKVYAVGD